MVPPELLLICTQQRKNEFEIFVGGVDYAKCDSLNDVDLDSPGDSTLPRISVDGVYPVTLTDTCD